MTLISKLKKKRENRKREAHRAEMRRRDKVLKDTRVSNVIFYKEKRII